MHATSSFIPRTLHIFKSHNNYYVFDSRVVRVVPIDKDEALFLEIYQNFDNIKDVGEVLGWKTSHTSNVAKNLSQKELISTSHPQLAETNPSSEVVEIMINVSQICNLNCSYCFVDKGRFHYGKKYVKKLSPFYTEQLIKKLPKGIPWAREFSIHFYGGEPLLNLPAIRAALDAAEGMKNSHLTFSITTNGTILKKEAISLLRRGSFKVILSVDGPAFIHDAYRRTEKGDPTHAKVMKFLQKLRSDPKLSVQGSCVIRKGWSLHQAREYLSTIDVDTFKAQAVRLPADHPLSLSELEKKDYVADLKEVADEVIACLRKGKTPRDNRFNSRILQILKGTRRTSYCGAGRFIFGVAANGNIFPCALLAGRKDMELGTLDEPVSIWVERGKKWAEANSPREECKKCWALPLCGGGCPVMYYACGERECELTRVNCELALAIFSTFYPDNLKDLLYLVNPTMG